MNNVEKVVKNLWGKMVEKIGLISFSQKSSISGKVLHKFSLDFSTSFSPKNTVVKHKFSIVST